MPEIVRSIRGNTYLGIDPGASGGLVALLPDGVVSTCTPKTEADLWRWTCRYGLLANGETPACFAVIEQVNGYVGGAGNPGSAMFKFGTSYGGLRMALVAAGIPFDQVTPGVWQKALGIPSRKRTESKGQWKNRLKAKAQQLFPHVAVTLATADALLIAEYCRRKREGTL